MSHEAYQWACYEAPHLYTPKGKPDTSARHVLQIISEHADKTGRNAWPGETRIAYATGYDEQTILRAQRRLVAAGLLIPDGRSRGGNTRWRLDMSLRRPDGEWGQMLAAADATRRAESAARQARRNKKAILDVSGTQNAGHATAAAPSEAASEAPGVDVSGTQNAGHPARRMPDIRHAECRTPTAIRNEPPEEPPVEPSAGGTLPPDPLRPGDPPTSDHRSEEENSLTNSHGEPNQPRTTTHAARGDALPGAGLTVDAEDRSLLVVVPTAPGSRRRRRRRTRPEVAGQRGIWPAPVPDSEPVQAQRARNAHGRAAVDAAIAARRAAG